MQLLTKQQTKAIFAVHSYIEHSGWGFAGNRLFRIWLKISSKKNDKISSWKGSNFKIV